MHLTPPLVVDARDAWVLQEWIRTDPAGSARALRARIVLLSRDGLGATAICERLGCSRQTVVTWRDRYRRDGVSGLRDAPRSGRPPTVDAAAVLARTVQPPPGDAVRWSTRLLAAELGISSAAVAGVWRSWGIVPGVDGRLRLATEPLLDAPITEVVGVHVDPPLRLLAVRTDAPAPFAGQHGARDASRGPRPSGSERASSGGPDPAALPVFLERLVESGGDRTAATALVVSGVGKSVWDWAALNRVGVHLVPETASWARLAHAACLLAMAARPGATAATALSHVLGDQAHWAPVSWLSRH